MKNRLKLPLILIIGLFGIGTIVTIVFSYGYNNTEWACKNIIQHNYQNDCLNNIKQYHENNILTASVIMIGITLGMPMFLTFLLLKENRSGNERQSLEKVE